MNDVPNLLNICPRDLGGTHYACIKRCLRYCSDLLGVAYWEQLAGGQSRSIQELVAAQEPQLARVPRRDSRSSHDFGRPKVSRQEVAELVTELTCDGQSRQAQGMSSASIC